MRLYYYTKLHHGLSTIRDKRVKIALYNSLNDPFDFIGVAAPTIADRKAVKKLRDNLSKKSGIICLSETWKEPLMWGHYAEAHKGVCLGFEVSAGQYIDIDYQSERPKVSDFGKRSISELTDEDRAKIARTKFDRWKYEREWRRIVPLVDQDIVDGNYYLPFGRGMELKTVLFGSRSGVTKEKIEQICKLDNQIKVGITRPANVGFDIVINRTETKKIVAEQNRLLQLPVPTSLQVNHAMERLFDSINGQVLSKLLFM